MNYDESHLKDNAGLNLVLRPLLHTGAISGAIIGNAENPNERQRRKINGAAMGGLIGTGLGTVAGFSQFNKNNKKISNKELNKRIALIQHGSTALGSGLGYLYGGRKKKLEKRSYLYYDKDSLIEREKFGREKVTNVKGIKDKIHSQKLNNSEKKEMIRAMVRDGAKTGIISAASMGVPLIGQLMSPEKEYGESFLNKNLGKTTIVSGLIGGAFGANSGRNKYLRDRYLQKAK